MTYNEIKEILLVDDVYFQLKKHEQEIFKLIPELEKCKGFEQNSKWHIYDVYEHILHVVSYTESNLCLRISALFHDIGKPLVYKEDENGEGHFYNHWNESLNIFKKYQEKFELSSQEILLISNLIYYHDINLDNMDSFQLNSLIDEFEGKNIELLFNLKKADLKSQSRNYHYLLDNIDVQRKKVIKYKNL